MKRFKVDSGRMCCGSTTIKMYYIHWYYIFLNLDTEVSSAGSIRAGVSADECRT